MTRTKRPDGSLDVLRIEQLVPTLMIWISLGLLGCFLCLVGSRLKGRWRASRRRYRRRYATVRGIERPSRGFPLPKPVWVRHEVLRLHEQTGLSHRKLADLFNQCHAAAGMSVGRTWVRDLLKAQAYAALHQQALLKHHMPPPLAFNQVWGIDMSGFMDSTGIRHEFLGVIDHGTRLNLALRRLTRFNAWTLAGCILLAVGKFGRPVALRLDNHPVHRSKQVRHIMRWAGIRLCFTQPASPWQNGRIERFFGTLKSDLRGMLVSDAQHLDLVLHAFRGWYNTVRPHQHLAGRTPAQAWAGIDPYRRTPQAKQWFEAWDGRLRGWVLRY